MPGRNRGWKVKQEPEAAAVQSQQRNSDAVDFFFFFSPHHAFMDVRNENELKPNTWHTYLVPFDLILRAFRIFKDCLFYLKPLCFIPLFVLKLLEIIKCCSRSRTHFPVVKFVL